MGNRAANGREAGTGTMTYFTAVQIAAGGQHTVPQYFKADGTLSATRADLVGEITYLRLSNTKNGQINVRIYGPHGLAGTAPDKYSTIYLAPAAATTAPGSIWEMPEGMKCWGIEVRTDPATTATVTIEAGR